MSEGGVKRTYKLRYGSERRRTVHKNNNNDAKMRRAKALLRLEKQLRTGKKTAKHHYVDTDLTVDDIKRIENEIEILKTRI